MTCMYMSAVWVSWFINIPVQIELKLTGQWPVLILSN